MRRPDPNKQKSKIEDYEPGARREDVLATLRRVARTPKDTTPKKQPPAPSSSET